MTKLHVLCTNIDNIGDKHLWQDDRLNTILREHSATLHKLSAL